MDFAFVENFTADIMKMNFRQNSANKIHNSYKKIEQFNYFMLNRS